MPKFFYTENNHRQYQPPDNFWRRFLKHRQKRKAQAQLDNYIKLRNPYRHDAPQKSRRLSWILPFGLGLLFVGWLAIMIYLPYFQISKISITGLKTIKQTKIENFIKDQLNERPYLPKKNYFLFGAQQLSDTLKESFPLRKITISKVFPDERTVAVEEKISSLVYDSRKYYYLLDENGALMEILGAVGETAFKNQPITASTTATSSLITTTTIVHVPEYQKITADFGAYPIIFDKLAPEKIELKQNLLSKEIIATALLANEEIEKRGIGRLKYFVMESQTAGLRTVTDKKFEILLSFFNPVAEQIANAETILRSNRPNEYIDVRFGERVFWK